MPDEPLLPYLPCLRRDAVVLNGPDSSIRIASSARHVVTIPDPPDGLVDWLAGLDGSLLLQESLLSCDLPTELLRYMLRELDRAGLLIDANTGQPFRAAGGEQRDALLLARQARDGAVRNSAGSPAPVMVWVRGSSSWTGALTEAIGATSGQLAPSDESKAELMVAIGDSHDESVAAHCDSAAGLGLAHLAVWISAVDAVLSPLMMPGATACRWCCCSMFDERGDDWPTWSYGGRTPERPRLPAHHRALVLALVVEHALIAADVMRGRLDPGSADRERMLDLRRGTVSVLRRQAHPACNCLGAAA